MRFLVYLMYFTVLRWGNDSALDLHHLKEGNMTSPQGALEPKCRCHAGEKGENCETALGEV